MALARKNAKFSSKAKAHAESHLKVVKEQQNAKKGQKRKKQEFHEEVEEGEPWLVSYADLMTLLFAFFVLMYTMEKAKNSEEENVVKMRKDIASFFGGSEISSAGKQPANEQSKANKEQKESASKAALLLAAQSAEAQATQAQLASGIKRQLDPTLFTVTAATNGKPFEISMSSSLAFKLAKANITNDANKGLMKLGETLAKMTDRVTGNPLLDSHRLVIAGHTDGLKLHSSRLFRSNWELSAARAATVTRLLNRYGVPEGKLMAVGYGSSMPVAPNFDDKGNAIPHNLAKNRRVSIQVVRIQEAQKPEVSPSP